MYCIQCNVQLADGSRFCANCGARVSTKGPSRNRRWKRKWLFLLVESVIFLIFFTIAVADYISRPEAMLRAFLAATWQGRFDDANKYISDPLRAGAFPLELNWLLGLHQDRPPGPDAIKYEDSTSNGGAQATITIQDQDNKPFSVPLQLQQDSGRWLISAPTAPAIASGRRQYFMNGLALYNNGEPDRAVLEYRKGLVLDPANPVAHRDLGRSIGSMGWMVSGNGARKDILQAYAKQAIDEFKVSLGLNPQDESAHRYLGLAWKDNGEPSLAVNEFRRALSIDPRDPFAHKFLAQALLALGGNANLREAAEEFGQACDLGDGEACNSYRDLTRGPGGSSPYPGPTQ
jgi:tetratricopeptide (TPR) repeat protein